jgi:hypothetical protein
VTGPPSVLTGAEVPEDAHLVAEQLQTAKPSYFGGVLLDRSFVYVGFTRDPCKHLAELQRKVADPSVFRVFLATHSYAQLEALTNRMTADSVWLQAHVPELTGYGPDIGTQTLGVGLRHVTDRAKSLITARYAGGDKGLFSFHQQAPLRPVNTVARLNTAS